MSKEARTNYNVTPEQFIEVWQRAQNAGEVAEKLGMPREIVHARASMYRQMGIKLKKMPRAGREGLDIDALNKLIEDIDQEKVGREAKTMAQDAKPGARKTKGKE